MLLPLNGDSNPEGSHTNDEAERLQPRRGFRHRLNRQLESLGPYIVEQSKLRAECCPHLLVGLHLQEAAGDGDVVVGIAGDQLGGSSTSSMATV